MLTWLQVLFQGLKASVSQILTIVFAFFSICIGITILQMSKIDPTQLKKLDRRSTMLLQAARSQTQQVEEKDVSGVEDPGIDALRGSFGAVGSIIRARSARRMSMNSRSSSIRPRHGPAVSVTDEDGQAAHYGAHNHYPGMKRHQLYDAPMPPLPDMFRSPPSDSGSVHGTPRNPTIKFGSQDLVHTYELPGKSSSGAPAVHEFQTVRGHNREASPGATDSTAATLGVGARYSNFLSLTSPGAESEIGTPRQFPRDSALLVESPTQEPLTNPLGAGAEPLTAPAAQDAFHHPKAEDPFARSPATALGGSFAHGSMDSVGSIDGLPQNSDDEDSHGPRANKSFFGRNNSPRRYPGASEDDEESRRLWKRNDSMDDEGGARPGTPGAIRLVRPPVGSGRF
jgi:magnesium transporter